MNELNILQEKWDRLQTKMTTLECAVLKSKSVNAAAELAAMQARIEKLERVEKIARQISKLFSKTDIIDIDEQDFNVWSIVGDAEKNELEAALRDVK